MLELWRGCKADNFSLPRGQNRSSTSANKRVCMCVYSAVCVCGTDCSTARQCFQNTHIQAQLNTHPRLCGLGKWKSCFVRRSWMFTVCHRSREYSEKEQGKRSQHGATTSARTLNICCLSLYDKLANCSSGTASSSYLKARCLSLCGRTFKFSAVPEEIEV